MRPTKPSTPAEYAVLFWIACLILVGFGAVCLVFGYRVPAEKAQEAVKLIRGGYGLIAVGIVMVIVRRLFSSF